MALSPAFLDKLMRVEASKRAVVSTLDAGQGPPPSWERELDSWRARLTSEDTDEFALRLSEDDETSAALVFKESHLAIGGRVWDGGVFLARNLQFGAASGLFSIKGTSVLELGAGTGIAGLMAAQLGASTVLLTDVSAVLPSLAANIKLNKDIPTADGSALGSRFVSVYPNIPIAIATVSS